MKSRRVILTIEAASDLPLDVLRDIESIEFNRAGISEYLLKHGSETDRIVQVQANAIRPTPSGLPSPHWRRITSDVKRKAKRAKGAK